MAMTANPNRISKVDVTNDTLTGRAGMVLFVRYLTTVGILPILGTAFGRMRKSAKGLAVCKLFQQVFCFLFDGTSRHLQYFDELSQDKGYAAVIETDPKDMASSHTVKRFFGALGIWCLPVFRKILIALFVWQLRIEKPREVRLTLDTMVMDNDEAQKRQGVEPTYKNKKGFQPLQMIWNRKIVDAIFRGGKKHSNHGQTAVHMIRRTVSTIRAVCGQGVFIVIRLDSGFFDEKILQALDELNVAFIVSGKMYQSIKEYMAAQGREAFSLSSINPLSSLRIHRSKGKVKPNPKMVTPTKAPIKRYSVKTVLIVLFNSSLSSFARSSADFFTTVGANPKSKRPI